MLRVYFRNNRRLLKQLCRIANECLLEFLRRVTHLSEGQLGMVMTIHTFGEYMGFNCHLHALVADGVFMPNGMFYVAPKARTRPLEQLFRARVIKMLVEEDLLAEDMARKLLKWKHSGFSVHNGKPIKRNDTEGLERVAQYIIRNPFSEQKMTYNEENGTVIYRSRMHAKTKRNFEIFSAEDFIAAITQHIPEKGFQMVRYYGWYSNRARGERAKRQAEGSEPDNPAGVQVIDVSDYQPRRLPSKKWRELIKKIWEVDPFACPRCGSEMTESLSLSKGAWSHSLTIIRLSKRSCVTWTYGRNKLCRRAHRPDRSYRTTPSSLFWMICHFTRRPSQDNGWAVPWNGDLSSSPAFLLLSSLHEAGSCVESFPSGW